MAAIKSDNNPDNKLFNFQVILWPKTKNALTAEDGDDGSAPCTQLMLRKPSMLALKASGDCSKPDVDCSKPSSCCRLCGQDQLLRLLDSSYPCVGDVEKYDAIIKECFGVDVPRGDLMICEDCVINLKNTQRFSALIYAAFGKHGSNFSFSNEEVSDDINNKLAIKTENNGTQTESKRHINKTKIIRIIRQKTTRLQVEPVDEQAMKAIINCSNCKHKYRINMPQREWKDFLCPRCKMREEKTRWCMRCNINVPIEEYREHFEQHLKTRNVIRNMIKDSSASQPHLPLTNPFGDNFLKEYSKKYGCAVCPRRYHTVDGVLDHINCEHSGDPRFGNCECFVCGKDMKMRYLLDKHMIGHAGTWIYECDTCKKMFRSKKGLNIHKKTHKKINKFTRCWY